jgi:FkbM family methyltransferase
MKMAKGIWLPDSDMHFERMMAKEPMRNYGERSVGVYQFAKLQKALSFTKTRRVAVDVGAHVGFWSMWLAREFDLVHAFEPVPEHASCWRRNMEGVDNVVIHELAVGKGPGLVGLVVDAENSGKSCVTENGGVAIVSLDELDLECVDFIKIDTEGYESAVLEGSAKTIAKCRPVIVVESNGQHDRYRLQEPVALLTSMGANVLHRMKHDVIMGWPDAI